MPEEGVGDDHVEVDVRDDDIGGVVHGTHALGVIHEGRHGFAGVLAHAVR